MGKNSPRKLRSGKIIENVYAEPISTKIHLNMEHGQNPISNSNSDSNPSEIHPNDHILLSGIEVNLQISQLQNEMSESKTFLATLTQQVIPR